MTSDFAICCKNGHDHVTFPVQRVLYATKIKHDFISFHVCQMKGPIIVCTPLQRSLFFPVLKRGQKIFIYEYL